MTNVMHVTLVFIILVHVLVSNILSIFKGLLNTLFTTLIISACNCNGDGSNDIACDNNGVCSCKANYMNDKCDACKPGFFDFPACGGNLYIFKILSGI